MIPPNPSPWEPRIWRDELANAYRSAGALLRALDLPEEPHHNNPFRTLVPRPFVARMHKRDRTDPLLKQVLPTEAELVKIEGFVEDPLEEASAVRTPGLIQKYAGRALLITTPGCAVNCRYCFRRHFPYQDHKPNELEQALQVLRDDHSIREIILSGGDPLLLTDQSIGNLLRALDVIGHIKRIRLHTRLPIVLPQRITGALLDLLTSLKTPVTLVAHCNHANELSEDTGRAFHLLRNATIVLLNQTVLLSGVNDSTRCQVELAEGLFAQGVLPYYLHLPDPIAGTQHFYVEEKAGRTLHKAMHAQLPGYLVPRLVKEVAGEDGKRLISG